MISKVKEFAIGQVFELDEEICAIVRFPFRTKVVLKAVDPNASDTKWSSCGVTIRYLREMGRAYPSLIYNPPQGEKEKQ